MDRTDEDRAVAKVTNGVNSFVAEMREKGIHLGMGKPVRCITCGVVWPCPGAKP